MLTKKFYIPIGALIIAICAIAFFALRSDTPKEPIKVYKPVTPADTPVKVTTAEVTETSTGGEVTDTSTGGHFHEEGTWHAEPPSAVEVSQSSIASEPHSEETAAEKFYREMARKIELKKARDAERDIFLHPILEKGELLTSKYQDVFTITPNKYKGFSQDEREEFYQKCVEVDLIINDLKEHFASLPKWVKDDIEKRRSGTITEMINLPPLSPIYGELAAMGGNSNNEK